MIRHRAIAAGIETAIGNHTFRATGITAYLENGGTLEHAQEIAAHESPRTTRLFRLGAHALSRQGSFQATIIVRPNGVSISGVNPMENQ
jgi:integrase